MKTLALIALSAMLLAVAPMAMAAEAEVENVTLNGEASMFPPEVQVQGAPLIPPDSSDTELSGIEAR